MTECEVNEIVFESQIQHPLEINNKDSNLSINDVIELCRESYIKGRIQQLNLDKIKNLSRQKLYKVWTKGISDYYINKNEKEAIQRFKLNYNIDDNIQVNVKELMNNIL